MSEKSVDEVVKNLKQLCVETGSLACFCCGHEHNCSTKGCAILRDAADRLEQQEQRIAELEAENEHIRQTHISRSAAQMLVDENNRLRAELKTSVVFCEEEYAPVTPEVLELLQKDGELEKYIQRERWHVLKVDKQRREIERLERELAAAVNLIAKLVCLCDMGKRNAIKVLRPMRIGAGDYMGTGYAFLDAFNRIWDDFISQSSAEVDALYPMIRKEIIMRGAREGEEK